MRKILLAVAAVALLSAATCQCKAEKAAVSRMEATHERVAKKLLEYVEKDPVLKPADKDDWKKLVESDKRNLDALKRSLED